MNSLFHTLGWRLLPGSLTAVAIALLLKVGAFQPLENIAYRQLFRLRGELSWDKNLMLVAIDDASVKELGRFPWSRQYYGKLLNSLAQSDASVVVINLIWSESSPEDAQLAAAMMNQGRVVLAQAWDATGVPLQPTVQLKTAAIATGHVLTRIDGDGLVRQTELQIHDQPALGVAAIDVYSLVQAPVELPDPNQPFWINWIGSARTLQQYSFVDVMAGRIPPEAFQKKIVLVGVTATGIDTLSTPFDSNPAASSIYLHATLIQNLLQHNGLTPLPQAWLWVILLIGGPGFSSMITGWRTRHQLMAMTSLCISWQALGLGLLHVNYLMPIACPITLLLLSGGAVVILERLRENDLLHRQVAQLWNRYHQDLVLNTTVPHHPLVPMQGGELPEPGGAIFQVAQLAALAEQFGRSQSAQAAIANTLSVGLLASDLDGTVWFCNPMATQWLHIKTSERLNGQLVPTWLSQEQWQTSLEQLRAGKSVSYANLCQGDRWFDMHLAPLVYRSKFTQDALQAPSLDGFLLLLEEMTDHKRVELELQQTKEAAEAANRAKSEFLARMSHELRTPLNAILGFAQLMNRDPETTTNQRDYLATINRNGEYLLQLIKDVLSISKIEAGRAVLEENSFNLHTLLNDLIDVFHLRADSKGLQLLCDRTATVPQYIYADECKLRQILTNLLDNAIKFTSTGQIILRVRQGEREGVEEWGSLEEEEYQPRLVFEVEDTGSGIRSEELNTVFDAFVQSETGRRNPQGTGLGLAICRRFVQLMGGDITVHSCPDRGTVFRFNIRFRPAIASEVEDTHSSTLVVGLEPGQPTYRILVVDDLEENRRLLVTRLQSVGFDVRQASDGLEALKFWSTYAPHLIWMDIQMPIMDGLAATRRIREQEISDSSSLFISQLSASIYHSQTTHRPPKTIIIALTASVFEEERKQFLAAGCDDFVGKPCPESVFFTKISQHLGVRYLYADTATVIVQTALPNMAQLAEAIATQSEQWRADLNLAARKADEREIHQLLEQLPESETFLRQAIYILTEQFQLEHLMRLTQPHVKTNLMSD